MAIRKFYQDGRRAWALTHIDAVMTDTGTLRELLEGLDPEGQDARITAIENMIPSQASADNPLADKEFVNSSISTNTADFKGTVNSVADLDNIQANNNDYAFVVSTDATGNTVYKRYKYNGTSWVFEYELNNSSFTAAQWAAINSNITSALVTKLSNLPTNVVASDDVRTVVVLTQTEFDALTTYDNNTEYNII